MYIWKANIPMSSCTLNVDQCVDTLLWWLLVVILVFFLSSFAAYPSSFLFILKVSFFYFGGGLLWASFSHFLLLSQRCVRTVLPRAQYIYKGLSSRLWCHPLLIHHLLAAVHSDLHTKFIQWFVGCSCPCDIHLQLRILTAAVDLLYCRLLPTSPDDVFN